MRKFFILLCLCAEIWADPSIDWNASINLSGPGVIFEPMGQVVSNDIDQVTAIWARFNGNWIVETAFSPNDGTNWYSPETEIASAAQAVVNPMPRIALNDNNIAIAIFVDYDTQYKIKTAYSDDGGQNWTTSAVPLDAQATLLQSPQITLQGENLAIACWEGLNGAIHSAFSSDGGVAWTVTGALSGVGAAEPQVAINIVEEACLIYEIGGRIQGSYSVDAGATWAASTPTFLSDTTAAKQKVALDDTGMAVAVWLRDNGVHMVIESIYSTDSGATWSSPQILSDPNEDADNPRVSLNSDGDTIVVWESHGAHTVIQYAYSFDGGFSFSSPIALSSPSNDNLSPDVSINDDGVAAIVYVDATDRVILGSSSIDAGITFFPPVVLSSSAGTVGHPSVSLNEQDNAQVIWSNDIDSVYTVQTLYGNYFNVGLTQDVKKLLFQRDYVNRIFCNPMPEASLYRIYSDAALTELLYEGTVPEFFHHGQKKGAQRTYYMTWADSFFEESSSVEVSTP